MGKEARDGGEKAAKAVELNMLRKATEAIAEAKRAPMECRPR